MVGMNQQTRIKGNQAEYFPLYSPHHWRSEGSAIFSFVKLLLLFILCIDVHFTDWSQEGAAQVEKGELSRLQWGKVFIIFVWGYILEY
ncbi:hypothetical protein XENTR_v10015295 [Xenopus tropicalis]|nr:hypothetical protein XENTR_v10015295 [Xenopus tropicalis]